MNLVLESLRDHAVFAMDPRGTVRGWNRGAERLFGYADCEILGGSAGRFFTPEDLAQGEPCASLDKALAAGRFEGSHWLIRKDGTRFLASRTLFGIRGTAREDAPWVLEIAHDVTNGKIQEQYLRVGEEQLAALGEVLRDADARCRAMIEAVEDAVFFVDEQGRILTWNPGARSLLGYAQEEIAGKEWSLLLAGEEGMRDAGARWPGQGGPDGAIRKEGQIARKDGSRFWAEIALAPIRAESAPLRGYCAMIRDLTLRRAAEDALRASEEQLRQSQKMDAIGRLAGGVAHDFNNLLTAILGFADLGLGMTEPAHPAYSVLEEIRKAGRTASELTRNLLAVSRKQPLAPVILDLSAMVEGSASMLQRILGANILFSTHLAPAGTLLVRADGGMLERILLNLAVNARDAMPEGGSLSVATRATDLAEPVQGEQGRLRPGRYATLIVSDTGIGMSEDVKAHLFEPFFTTKAKGTGLGLSTTYGIVRQNGGEIAVVSEPGFGTAFFIHFPRAEGKTEDWRPAAPQAISPAAGERILVVDDEEMVRKFVVRVLENAGYRVRAAASGQAALEAWDAEQGGFDALLTDIVMPGMNGLALAERLRAREPRLKVLVMSGFPADVDMEESLARKGSLFLGKPFTPEGVLRALQEALRPAAFAS